MTSEQNMEIFLRESNHPTTVEVSSHILSFFHHFKESDDKILQELTQYVTGTGVNERRCKIETNSIDIVLGIVGIPQIE
jgi:hypothetical protein